MKKIAYFIVFLLLSYGAKAQWSLSGNAATSSNFLGTTNAQPLNIKINNVQRMIFKTYEKNGLGYNLTDPKATFHIHRSGILYQEDEAHQPPGEGGGIAILNSVPHPLIQPATFLLTNHVSGISSGFLTSFDGTNVTQQLQTEGKFSIFAKNYRGIMIAPNGKITIGKSASYDLNSNYQFYVDSSFYAMWMTGKRLTIAHTATTDWSYALYVATNRDLTKAMVVTNPSGDEVFRVMGNGITYSKYLISNQIKIDLNAQNIFWYDHVFSPEYQLLPLRDVEQFVKVHRHLPDIPSEKEVKENGLNLAEMDALLLKKVEELTLYIIDQQKQIETLKGFIENLQKQLKNTKGGE